MTTICPETATGMTVLTEASQESFCRLVFEGKMTSEYSRQLEDGIIDAMRRYSEFEIDLAGVREIDVCGIHLLGLLNTVGGDRVRVVGSSPAIQQAYERLAPRRGTWLRGSREERARAV